MSTTTIRLDEDLRTSVAEAARIEGVSAHAFMVEAIARRARELAEREAFITLASERWEQYARDGRSVPLGEMRQRVRALAAGSRRQTKAPARHIGAGGAGANRRSTGRPSKS